MAPWATDDGFAGSSAVYYSQGQIHYNMDKQDADGFRRGAPTVKAKRNNLLLLVLAVTYVVTSGAQVLWVVRGYVAVTRMLAA